MASSTPSPSAGTKTKILEDNEDDDDGERVPISDKDTVLADNWEKYGDRIICANNKEIYEKFIAELQKDFVLSSHGKLEWYLGCKIIQDMEKGTVTINQEKYANDVAQIQHAGSQTGVYSVRSWIAS